jgi:UDP-glucose 4-epimerase
MKERNVIGTMQLLAACQKAHSVRRLVVKSSAAVYGCAPRDPALFGETPSRTGRRAAATARTSQRSRSTSAGSPAAPGRRGHRAALRRLPRPGVDTAFADYLALPVLPTVAASTRGCSSCTSTTWSRRAHGRVDDTHPGTTTWPAPGR